MFLKAGTLVEESLELSDPHILMILIDITLNLKTNKSLRVFNVSKNEYHIYTHEYIGKCTKIVFDTSKE